MNAWADNPQAVQIDALVERAGRLIGEEVKGLTAAWGAAWAATPIAVWVAASDAARTAAWTAARYVAWDVIWVAARDAAWDTDWDTAWGAVREVAREVARAAWTAAWAARALVVRDLIDEHTAWNQAAYDLLTGPWRRVVGPIHPDDEVLA